MFYANRNQKKVGVDIFTSDKIDFKPRMQKKKKNKGGHYMIKLSNQQEDIIFVIFIHPK